MKNLDEDIEQYNQFNIDNNISLNDNINDIYNNYLITNQNNQLKLELFPKKEEKNETRMKSMINKLINDYNEQNESKIENLEIKENNNKDNLNINSYKSNIVKNFSPDFWMNFYDKDDKFFNYDYNKGYNLIKKTITTNYPNYPNIEETYEGEINDKGEKHGFGKLINMSMERIGSWKNNQFTGWGREARKTGEIIEGKFIGGVLNGKGIYKDAKLV